MRYMHLRSESEREKNTSKLQLLIFHKVPIYDGINIRPTNRSWYYDYFARALWEIPTTRRATLLICVRVPLMAPKVLFKLSRANPTRNGKSARFMRTVNESNASVGGV